MGKSTYYNDLELGYIYRYTDTNGWELLDSLPSNLNSYTDKPIVTHNLFYKVVVKKNSSCDPNKSGILAYSSSNYGLTEFTISVSELNDNKAKVILYPNPAGTCVTIESDLDNNSQVEMYNLLGETVMVAQIPYNGKIKIDVSSIKEGLYVYRISSGNNTIRTGKLLIQH